MRLETVRNELAQVTEQEKSLRRRQAESEESLQKVRRDYETLKEESSDFLKLKKEYTAAKASLEDVAGRLRELTQENERLRNIQQFKWFGMGALIPLFGLLIGVLAGRAQRKRKMSYS